MSVIELSRIVMINACCWHLHNSFPYRNVIVSHSIILQSYSNMMTFISCIVIVAESGGFLYELLIQTSLVNQHIL